MYSSVWGPLYLVLFSCGGICKHLDFCEEDGLGGGCRQWPQALKGRRLGDGHHWLLRSPPAPQTSWSCTKDAPPRPKEGWGDIGDTSLNGGSSGPQELEIGKTKGLSGPISRDIAIVSLRYPPSANFLGHPSNPPTGCDTSPWCLLLHRHISAIPHFATYCAILVRYPRKTSTKKFCDTIADMKSIAAGPLSKRVCLQRVTENNLSSSFSNLWFSTLFICLTWLWRRGLSYPLLFCASCFPFFLPAHPTPLRHFSTSNPLFLGPENYSFKVFSRGDRGFWGGVWTGRSTGEKKGISFRNLSVSRWAPFVAHILRIFSLVRNPVALDIAGKFTEIVCRGLSWA